MRTNLANKIEKIIGLAILGLVFVLLIFTYSKTASPIGMDSFNKSYLLWFMAPFLAALWLLVAAHKEKFIWKYTALDIPIFILLIVFGLAAVFSLNIYSSLFGAYSSVVSPYLTILSTIVFYYLLVQLSPARSFHVNMARVLFVVYGLMVIFLTILLFGVWGHVFTEGDIFVSYIHRVWGSVEDATLLLSILNILVLGILIDQKLKKEILPRVFMRRIFWSLFAVSFLFIIFSNFIPAWWTLLLGTFIIAGFKAREYFEKWQEIITRKKKTAYGLKILGLGAIIVLALTMLIINFYSIDSSSRERRLSRELKLKAADSLIVSLSALRTKPLLGYGPEQYGHVFSLFRDSSLNDSFNWDRRFNRSSSYFIELIATTGALGVLAYLLWVGVLAAMVIRELREKSDPMTVILAALIFVLLFSQFVYTINVVLYFLLWFFIALFIINTQAGRVQEELAINVDSRTRLAMVLAGIFLLSGWVALSTVLARQWSAEYLFRTSGNNIAKLSQAARLNPWRYQYQIALAGNYKEKALDSAAKINNKDNLKSVSEDINIALHWAEKSVRTAPFAVNTYTALAAIYRDILPFSPSSAARAVAAFDRAIAFEPSNPVLYNEKGQVLANSGQIELAIDTFVKAAVLKADYSAAELNLAKAYNTNGQFEEALQTLKKLENYNPNSKVYYEQGRVYFNEKKYQAAIEKFGKVVAIEPLHANALYSLALSYEAIGDSEQAVYYLKKVQTLNPEQNDVREKIEELEK